VYADLWRIAGSLGITDPRPLTLRQLLLMTEGRDRHLWNVVSQMMALVANCHRDSKRQRKPFSPDDFNPVKTKKRKQGILVTPENIQELHNALKGLDGG
jgi:hypothetical protein